MTISVGEVIAVNGVKITLRVFDESNKEMIFFNGDKYKGISIREHIAIKRGFRDIICIVEGEYLDEKKFENDGNQTNFIRKVEVKPIGYFENGQFCEGIKFLPMIKDSAFLLQEDKISQIYSEGSSGNFVVGKMLKEEIPISLPWDRLFNSHIGIFGNTGSGKSNTLAKIYTVLFEQKLESVSKKSKFIILDFNGEYTGEQLIGSENKTVLNLNTQTGSDEKFPLSEEEFWNAETLSILFQATLNTQRPFLNRIINGRKKYSGNTNSLLSYIKSIFKSSFSAASPKRETLDLLRDIVKILNITELDNILSQVSWRGDDQKFFIAASNTWFQSDGINYEAVLGEAVEKIDINNLDQFDELVVRVNLQLIRDLISGYVQFEHIQPLLKRIESSLTSLRKVILINSTRSDEKLLTVISLRRCNQEMKKVLPLLIAKHYYNQHKNTVANPPNKTMHFIIDEAHNILSQQSSSEHESWKDYRLEMFEEIIKEGRKFGMFLTLSSQRPADISPTVVSQLHNFFIHRLVNDRDLFLLDNTISTLDNLSRGLIPNLSKGCCIVTGTSFDIPMILQINRLESSKRPDSEDVDLSELWSN